MNVLGILVKRFRADLYLHYRSVNTRGQHHMNQIRIYRKKRDLCARNQVQFFHRR